MSAKSSVNVIPTSTDSSNVGLPVGTILTFAGASAPANYLFCNGAAVKKADYPNLYAVIKDIYINGSSPPPSDSFNLPDTSSRTIRGKAATGTFSQLNNPGGSDSALLQAKHMAPHRHGVLQGGGPYQIQSGTGTSCQGYDPNVDTGIKTIAGAIYDNAGTSVAQTALDYTNSYIVLNHIIKYA